MIDTRNLPITFHSSFLHQDAADDAFQMLMADLDWLEVTPARKEYYVNDFGVPYTYGTGDFARTYQPQATHDVIELIRHGVEQLTGVRMDTVFLNRYDNERNQLGWHADDSPEMDDARPIVIVSLGAEREIMFRENANLHESTSLLLSHGSACIMGAGMQDTHQHRIPKSGRQCGPRISLTFRGFVHSNA